MSEVIPFKSKIEEIKEKDEATIKEFYDSLKGRLDKYIEDNCEIVIVAYKFGTDPDNKNDGMEITMDGRFPPNIIEGMALTYALKDYLDNVIKARKA